MPLSPCLSSICLPPSPPPPPPLTLSNVLLSCPSSSPLLRMSFHTLPLYGSAFHVCFHCCSSLRQCSLAVSSRHGSYTSRPAAGSELDYGCEVRLLECTGTKPKEMTCKQIRQG